MSDDSKKMVAENVNVVAPYSGANPLSGPLDHILGQAKIFVSETQDSYKIEFDMKADSPMIDILRTSEILEIQQPLIMYRPIQNKEN